MLYGGREGTFQYANVVSINSKTADGMVCCEDDIVSSYQCVNTHVKLICLKNAIIIFHIVLEQDLTVKGTHKDGVLASELKATYDSAHFKLVSTLAQASGKVGLSLTGKKIVPGMNVTLSGNVPDTASAKVAVDYTVPHVTVKASSTLTPAPMLDLGVTTNVVVKDRDIVVGGEGAYDAAKGLICSWKVGLGYTALDYQLAATLSDKKDVTAMIAHSVNPDVTIGAEVVRNIESAETSVTAGVARRLPSGALQKIKVQHTGIVSVLHEQTLEGNSKLALSSQFDAKDLSKTPKYGVSVDFKY